MIIQKENFSEAIGNNSWAAYTSEHNHSKDEVYGDKIRIIRFSKLNRKGSKMSGKTSKS